MFYLWLFAYQTKAKNPGNKVELLMTRIYLDKIIYTFTIKKGFLI